ncbi:MAG: hypothetical protein GF311_07420 [Candidatus Lokiarchaeota archaeon]|nr:hypothetical protein [Candidatus Lokiarchaeota archaeon]
MCNNCNCNNYEKCSITGYMPIGFCCSNCDLYDEKHTCLKMQQSSSEPKLQKITPISTTIENGILKVIIEQDKEKIPIFIDIDKQLGQR